MKDVSFLWHTADEFTVDYTKLPIDEKQPLEALNKASQSGFRLALIRLEDMGVISLSDIDRSPTLEDYEKAENL